MRTFLTAAALVTMSAWARASDRETVVRKLDTMKVTVDLKDASLDEAVSYLRELTGVNFVLQANAVDSDARVTLRVRDLTVKHVLKLMLEPMRLTASWKDGAVVILPREHAEHRVTLQLYDVRAHLAELRDFPGPTVELVSPTAGGGPLVGAKFELDDPESFIPEDTLLDLVKGSTGGTSWEDNPNASLELVNGRLVVNQSPRVHAEIRRFLRLLGRYR